MPTIPFEGAAPPQGEYAASRRGKARERRSKGNESPVRSENSGSNGHSGFKSSVRSPSEIGRELGKDANAGRN